MSRVFENFVQQVFASNPYAYADEVQKQLDVAEQEHKHRQKRLKLWQSGKVTEEWISYLEVFE